MEQSEVVNIIIQTINSIFNNLFSSIDNNIYTYLDNFIFINKNIINNSFFENILGSNGKNGILYLSDSLFLGIIIYYSLRYAYSSFSGTSIEKPPQFIFKMILLGIIINFSYFMCEQLLHINFLLSESIKEIGKSIVHKDISFSSLIIELNSVISIGNNNFDLFSFDGIIKGFVSVGLFNLLFTYSLRYVMIQIFIITTPLAFLSLINSSTSWVFKSWLKAFFSLLILQSFVSIILILMLSFDSSNKLLLIGSIYALIRSNSYIRDIFGGINVDVSNNITSYMSNFKN